MQRFQTRAPIKDSEIVARCMTHGSCGIFNPNSSCIVNVKGKKTLPKDFQLQTVAKFQGDPLNKRRPGITVNIRNTDIDNRFVVPYNRHLLLRYQCGSLHFR